MRMELSVLISLISAFACLTTIFFSFKSSKRTDTQDIEKDAEWKAESKIMLTQISNDMKDVKVNVSNISNEVKELRDRIVCCEQSTKSAHKRIDDMVSIGNDHFSSKNN